MQEREQKCQVLVPKETKDQLLTQELNSRRKDQGRKKRQLNLREGHHQQQSVGVLPAKHKGCPSRPTRGFFPSRSISLYRTLPRFSIRHRLTSSSLRSQTISDSSPYPTRLQASRRTSLSYRLPPLPSPMVAEACIVLIAVPMLTGRFPITSIWVVMGLIPQTTSNRTTLWRLKISVSDVSNLLAFRLAQRWSIKRSSGVSKLTPIYLFLSCVLT